jgi:AbrB family looped-hinge helix DNA binding protein
VTQHATQQGFALVRIDENGCITMPAEQRKLLGLAEGVVVVATVKDAELSIRPVSSVITDLQAPRGGRA